MLVAGVCPRHTRVHTWPHTEARPTAGVRSVPIVLRDPYALRRLVPGHRAPCSLPPSQQGKDSPLLVPQGRVSRTQDRSHPSQG